MLVLIKWCYKSPYHVDYCLYELLPFHKLLRGFKDLKYDLIKARFLLSSSGHVAIWGATPLSRETFTYIPGSASYKVTRNYERCVKCLGGWIWQWENLGQLL